MMRRREFMMLMGGVAAVAWPLESRAQERVRRVGVLLAAYKATDQAGQARIAAFRDALQRLGWGDGRNILFDYRWSGGNVTNAKTLAAELVESAPDAIVVAGDPALTQLYKLTSAIPIVFTQVSEPVDSGFVASFARPGSHITGFQNFEPAMGGKWLTVLKEIAPNIKRVGAIFSLHAAPRASFLRAAELAAPSLDVRVNVVDIPNSGEIERAIAKFAGQPDSGLLVFPHPSTIANRGLINALAARHQLPAIYPYRYFAIDGGLVSYGPPRSDRSMARCRAMHRPYPQRRKAGRPSSAGTNKI
jgi:putative tryptophan/tyrosine transport system substrate-binding protein